MQVDLNQKLIGMATPLKTCMSDPNWKSQNAYEIPKFILKKLANSKYTEKF